MIRKSEIDRLWRKTIVALFLVDAVAVFILVSFVFKRVKTFLGPTLLETGLLFILIVVANIAYYVIARSIKDKVKRQYGE